MKTLIKNFTLLSIVFLIINPAFFSNKESEKKVQKKYSIEKGTVEYKVSGDALNGTEILYFDSWGSREAKYTTGEVKIGGIKQKVKTITFMENDMVYTVDLNTNTGTKWESILMNKISDKKSEDMGKELMIELGAKKIGSGNVIGKKCDIWEIKNLSTKTWVWNWIPLKTEVNMVGVKTITVATKFLESVDAKKLTRPKNISYTERSDPMKMLEQMKKSN